MGLLIKGFFGLLVIGILYFMFWPTGLSPAPLNVPNSEGYVGAFAPNDRLKNLRLIALPHSEGPEDVAVGPDGLLYTGLADGSIIRIDPVSGASETLAHTGGRPLGVEFDGDGDLYIADAYKGLLVLTRDGDLITVADKADDGSTIGYADDLDVSANGIVYFTDASTKFTPAKFGGTLEASLPEIWEGRGTGRVLSYNSATGNVKTLMTGIVFSNGLALSEDDRFFLVNETGKHRVLKYTIATGITETFLDNLPGYPDNVNPDTKGGFFLGLVNPRAAVADDVADRTFLRNVLWRLPGFKSAVQPKPYSHLVRLNAAGDVLETWQDPAGAYEDVTGAVRDGEVIYVTSLHETSIGVLKD